MQGQKLEHIDSARSRPSLQGLSLGVVSTPYCRAAKLPSFQIHDRFRHGNQILNQLVDHQGSERMNSPPGGPQSENGVNPTDVRWPTWTIVVSGAWGEAIVPKHVGTWSSAAYVYDRDIARRV